MRALGLMRASGDSAGARRIECVGSPASRELRSTRARLLWRACVDLGAAVRVPTRPGVEAERASSAPGEAAGNGVLVAGEAGQGSSGDGLTWQI